MTPVVIGVDPGVHGAIAAIDVATLDLMWIEDMPREGNEVSPVFVTELLEREPGAPVACERVHGGGKGEHGSAATAFVLGDAYGVIRGCAGALRRELILYRPQAWKGTLGLTSDKARSLALAVRTWPHHAGMFKFKTNVDRAEAALIAKVHAERVRRLPPPPVGERDPW